MTNRNYRINSDPPSREFLRENARCCGAEAAAVVEGLGVGGGGGAAERFVGVHALLGVQREVTTRIGEVEAASASGSTAAGGGSGDRDNDGGESMGSLEEEWAILENGGKITLRLAPYEKEGSDEEEEGSGTKTPP